MDCQASGSNAHSAARALEQESIAPGAVQFSEALTSAYFTEAAILDQGQAYAIFRKGPLPSYRGRGRLFFPARDRGDNRTEDRAHDSRKANPHGHLGHNPQEEKFS